MKTSLALLVLAAAGTVALVACGGTHRRNNDWRALPPATACASDADCGGGPCAIEMGATKGTCQPVDLVAPAHGGDGGARPSPSGPPPLIQPSPSDIQI
jgi:hypothetical protein